MDSDAPGNKAGERRHLRFEALGRSFESLTLSQREAALKVLGAIAEAQADLEEPSEEWHRRRQARTSSAPTSIEERRSSRLVFISGDRGTGKTSVLLTLLRTFDTWRSRATGRAAGQTSEPAARFYNSVEQLDRHVVWLETLDLEPLAHPTNLLVTVLMRIEQAFRRMVGGSAGQGGGVGLEDEDPLHKLACLTTDIALAWHGNVPERAAQLDPDPYAEETKRAEEARLLLGDRLAEVLAGLAERIAHHRGRGSNPLFVLPVDDFDLNPLRALEVLHLIRMVSPRRLFLILMGDARLTEIVTALRKSGEFAEVIRHAKHESCLALPGEEVGGVVRAVSAHAVRKLLPPAQRIELRPPEIAEALNFSGGRTEDPWNGGPDSLAEIMKTLPVEIESAMEGTDHAAWHFSDQKLEPPGCKQRSGNAAQGSSPSCEVPRHTANLCQFLDFDPWPAERQDAASETKKSEPNRTPDGPAAATGAQQPPYQPTHHTRENPYTGAFLLKAAPRHLADLWFSLREVAELNFTLGPEAWQAARLRQRPNWDPRLSDLVEVIGRETRRAIQEDPLLWVDAREALLTLVQLGPGDEWLQDATKVASTCTTRDGLVVDDVGHAAEQAVQPAAEPAFTFTANKFGDWLFEVDGEVHQVSDLTRACIVLLHDLLALKVAGGLVAQHPLSPDPLKLNWAVASWRVDVPGPDQWVEFSWPAPPWTSFWEFELLAELWRREIDRVARVPRHKHVELLAFAWIAGVHQLLFQTAPVPGSCMWTALAHAVCSTLQKRDLRSSQGRVQRWAVHLGALLAPECGIKKALVTHFLSHGASGNSAFLVGVAKEVRALREARFARLYELGEAGEDLAIFFGAIPTSLRDLGLEVGRLVAQLPEHHFYTWNAISEELAQLEAIEHGTGDVQPRPPNERINDIEREWKKLHKGFQAATSPLDFTPVYAFDRKLRAVKRAGQHPYNDHGGGCFRPLHRSRSLRRPTLDLSALDALTRSLRPK